MNHDRIITTTNRVAFYTTVALVYWVFVFLTTTVFDLRVFRERLTDTFFLSLLGIFAVMGGAIVLNVMSNLSKISAAVSSQPGSATAAAAPGRRWRSVLALLAFPLIASVLFLGDHLSAERRKELLVASAEHLIAENQPALATLADYTFSPEYVANAERTLGILNKIDKNLPQVMVIVADAIDEKALFLGFGGGRYGSDDETVEKAPYIYSTSQDEREYLEAVFSTAERTYRFRADKGNYELYFPAEVNGKRLVLYFSDYQRYGKFGS